MMYNSVVHHLLTDVQPISQQRSADPSQLPQLTLGMTFYQFRPAVLDLGLALLSNNQNIHVLSTLLS